MPNHIPLTKPTRDISASNKSHSFSREDLNDQYYTKNMSSEKRIILLEKDL
jgi:hypothetical protein